MELCSALMRSKPFIYLISGKYYLISSKTFFECTGEDENFAREFVEEAYNLLKLHKCMTLVKKDIEKYNELYNRVIEKDEQIKQDPGEARHEIGKILCLNKDNENEIASLRQQYEKLKKLLWLQTELECADKAEKEAKD